MAARLVVPTASLIILSPPVFDAATFVFILRNSDRVSARNALHAFCVPRALPLAVVFAQLQPLAIQHRSQVAAVPCSVTCRSPRHTIFPLLGVCVGKPENAENGFSPVELQPLICSSHNDHLLN